MKTPQPWYNNLLGSGTNIFGAGTDIDMQRNKKLGLLEKTDIDQARNASLTKGLIGSVVGYLAQPKNEDYGSGLPYIFKGLQQGMKSAQQPFDALKDKASANLKLDELIDTQETKKFADADIADFIKRNPEYNGIQNLENRDAIIAKAMEQLGTYKYKGANGGDWKYEEQEILAEMDKLRSEGMTDEMKIKSQAFENVRARKHPMKEESAYSTYIGTEGAKGDMAIINGAKRGAEQVARLDQALELINSTSTRTGAFAGVLKQIDKAKYMIGVGDQAKIQKSISNTELLEALLGGDVFPMIKELGIGARGLDTPAEREFLQKVMTGEITMNRDTLMKLTIMRRNNFAEAVEIYNRKYDGDGWKRIKESALGADLQRMEYATGKDSAFVSKLFQQIDGKKQTLSLHADGSIFNEATGEQLTELDYDLYSDENKGVFMRDGDEIGNKYGFNFREKAQVGDTIQNAVEPYEKN